MLHNTTDAELCAQARREIIAASLKNGGHLASNLGAVELTVALHRVFQPARDRIVWDVGHQCYTHKWLTGRDISKIRTSEGPSGFPKPAESETDAFATGHASTAISAALGMARARDLQGEDYACIAVVGDGALTGGMCYEALCDAGASKTPLIIIINDNRMSISQSTGAMHEMLTRMRASRGYHRAKRSVEFGLQRIPLLGKPIARCIKWFKNIVGRALLGDTMFDDMGLVYLGPIDGHNIREMQLIFRRAAALSLPVIVHVCTVKGLGYGAAESDPEDYHGVDPRKMTIDNAQCTINKLSIVNSALLVGNWLCERAVNDEKIVAITAAMCKGCGLTGFAAQYPNRFFDVGICEEHAVTMAAGMAMGGLRPVVCVYSTFLQRGVDQLLHDVCLQNLPVTLCIDRCGPVGPDGETHHGIYDLAMLRAMPNLTILSPASPEQLHAMLDWAATHDGPVAIRYGRGPLPLVVESGKWTVDSWKPLQLTIDNAQLTIIATGPMCGIAVEAGKKAGAAVYHAPCLSRVDEDFLKNYKNNSLFVIEENVAAGGYGEAVCAAVMRLGLPIKVHVLAMPSAPMPHDTPAAQLAGAGLDVDSVAKCLC